MSTKTLFFVYILPIASLILLWIPNCQAAPIEQGSDKMIEIVTFTSDAQRKCFEKTTNYLTEFNKLSKWNYLTGKPTTEMIKSLQKHIELPETGELDEETCNFMNQRWEQKIITWRLKNKNLGAYFMENSLHASFAEWSSAVDLVFVEVDSDYADIQISFDEKPEKCAGIELTIENGESFACVYSPGSGIGGDVFIYDHKQWADNTDTAIDGNEFKLSSGALHMIGFSLGWKGDKAEKLNLSKDKEFQIIDFHDIQIKYGKIQA